MLTLACLWTAGAISMAGSLDTWVEAGGVWFTRNDARIPGDTGTRFDLLDLTGRGPDPYVRLYTRVDFNERHSVRFMLAPLETDGTGILRKEVNFRGQTFEPGIPTEGTFRFNTYRVGYLWTFHHGARSRLGVGAVALIRDAEISLEQMDRHATKENIGLVPLLQLHGELRLTDRAALVLDAEGAGSSSGRALDVALLARSTWKSGLYAAVGYRTLEGGAENDDVYTFSWLHFALVQVGYRF